MEKFNQTVATAQDLFTKFGLSLIAAIAILVVGIWAAKLVKRLLKRLMQRQSIDPTLLSFVSNLAYYTILAFVAIAALNQLGVQTASFIAILGAAGLAVGLALQGSLENFAAGVLMIIFRPFCVGDFIEAGGVSGTVEEIQLFTTTLRTLDNRLAIVPNAKLGRDTIINYTANATRRIDLIIGVSYETDLSQAKRAIYEELAKDSRILKDPAPFVGVFELGDSSVNLAVRPWVAPADYWSVYFDLHETIKNRLDLEGIVIPYPQRDIHLYQRN